ncbi:hypothetical protein [Natrarchaeobius chitinivorans]|uniref:hypothetical protein n=1 Tax=Natrarchaeobius chitinivorans TaxID=1679083 RepID=UPI000F525DD3|nr:hypothetical protein [Natrarchaeobius chitinivorans]
MSSFQQNRRIADRHLESLLRGLVILAIISAFVEGPMVEFGYIGLFLFDLIILFLACTLLLYLPAIDELSLPSDRLFLHLTTIYLLLVVTLPFLGIIVYGHPLEYVVGDIRWLQVYLVGVIALTVYSKHRLCFKSDVVYVFKWVVGIYFSIFLFQLSLFLELYDTSPLLEFWFLNQSTYGELGYHIGRFSGAGSSPSLIGLVALIGILLFFHTYFENRENITFGLLSLVLLIASGQRTAFVATVILITVLFTFHTNALDVALNPKAAVPSIGGISAGFLIAYRLNIGRLQSDSRFDELLVVILNPHKLPQVSGRGPRWEAAISDMSVYYPIGTLANPAHVLDTKTIDSYYVIAFTQGHFLLLLVFLSFIIVAWRTIVKYRYQGRQYAIFAIIFFGPVTILSSMQNFLTSITGKMTLVLAITFMTMMCHKSIGNKEINH